jgi:hypothetical protein
MDEESTTDAPEQTGGQTIQGVQVDDQGMAVPEPETSEETAEEPKPQEESQPTEEPSKEDTLDSWAKNKGLTLDTDSARKAAEMARNAERAMHEKARRASELEKSMLTMGDESAEAVAEQTGQDAGTLKRVQRMEIKDAIRDFWDQNPDARTYEKEMAEIATTAGLYGSPEAILKASYAMARAQNEGATKSAAKREALESLAQQQQAAVPQGNAVTAGTTSASKITSQNVDQLVAQNDQKWFEDHYDEINKAMAA